MPAMTRPPATPELTHVRRASPGARTRRDRAPGAALVFTVTPWVTRPTVWLLLTGLSVLSAVLAGVHGGGYSWHYFAQGAWLLTHPGLPGGGLHLYASHPELQIGPLALLAAVPGQLVPVQASLLLAAVVLTALGLALLWLLTLVRAQLTGRDTGSGRLLLIGACLLPVWSQLAVRYIHLDDALALGFGVLALYALVRRQGALLGAALAAAVDAKPWALGFAVLLWVLPAPQRRRGMLVGAALVVVAWLPFLLADSRTLQVGRFTIANAADSALRALGVGDPVTPPWDRPAQLLLGVCCAAVAVRHRQWRLVLLAVVTSRLLLDPQTHPYYSAGLLVAAAAADLLASRRTVPWWSIGCAGWVAIDAVTSAVVSPAVSGTIRAGFCVAVLVSICLTRGTRTARTSRRRPGSDRPAGQPGFAAEAVEVSWNSGSARGSSSVNRVGFALASESRPP